MERELGRLILGEEVVHHVNGKRDDNRVENLRVLTRFEHGLLKHGYDEEALGLIRSSPGRYTLSEAMELLGIERRRCRKFEREFGLVFRENSPAAKRAEIERHKDFIVGLRYRDKLSYDRIAMRLYDEFSFYITDVAVRSSVLRWRGEKLSVSAKRVGYVNPSADRGKMFSYENKREVEYPFKLGRHLYVRSKEFSTFAELINLKMFSSVEFYERVKRHYVDGGAALDYGVVERRYKKFRDVIVKRTNRNRRLYGKEYGSVMVIVNELKKEIMNEKKEKSSNKGIGKEYASYVGKLTKHIVGHIEWSKDERRKAD
jgi:hypothetical protein